MAPHIRSGPATGIRPDAPRTERPKAVPLTDQQKEERNARRRERDSDIDNCLNDWFENTLSLADRLAEKYDMKPRYFLDKMFYGGACLVNTHQRTNAWNAFVSVKTGEMSGEKLRKSIIQRRRLTHFADSNSADDDDGDDDGDHRLKDISGKLAEEYAGLTDAEKKKFINDYEDRKDERRKTSAFHVTSRGRLQNVNNCIRVMTQMVSVSEHIRGRLLTVIQVEAMKMRHGCEGFFVIVRGSTSFAKVPHWYLSSKELAEYLPFAINTGRFETASVGTRLEAFAIAGCSVMSENDPTDQLRQH